VIFLLGFLARFPIFSLAGPPLSHKSPHALGFSLLARPQSHEQRMAPVPGFRWCAGFKLGIFDVGHLLCGRLDEHLPLAVPITFGLAVAAFLGRHVSPLFFIEHMAGRAYPVFFYENPCPPLPRPSPLRRLLLADTLQIRFRPARQTWQ